MFHIQSSLFAQVSQFTDKHTWEAAVSGGYSTIDFTGFADGTMITNKYQFSGVNVVGWAQIWQTGIAVNDGWGLWGTNGLRLSFDTPQYWIATDYPGAIRLNLLYHGAQFYTSTYFQPGGTGHFAGLVSGLPFDEVYLDKGPPGPNYVFIDDLHWGAPVPAPGVVGVFALAGLLPRRRRRGSYGLRHQRFSMRGCS